MEPAAHPAPRRVVAMTPGLAEILVRLGAADRVVGVADGVVGGADSRELAHAARLGNLLQPDMTALEALRPELVVTVHDVALERSLADRGVPYLALSLDSFQLLLDAVRKIGERLEMDESARRVERELLDQIERTRERLRDLPPQRVLFVLGPEPYWVAGYQSIYHDMLHFTGATNAAAGRGRRLYALADEDVARANPEAIVVAVDLNRLSPREQQRVRQYWRRYDVPATRTGRVLLVDEDPFLDLGPHSLNGWMVLARALHPEVLAKRDLPR